MYHNVFIHSQVEKHLDCIGDFLKKISEDVTVQVFVNISFYLSWVDTYLRVENLVILSEFLSL